MLFNMLLDSGALLSEAYNMTLLSFCSAISGICRGFKYL